MSDSLVHVEIEDVLNTVRRLVSEKDSDETAEKTQESDASDTCFLLTPDYRVATDEPRFRHRAPKRKLPETRKMPAAKPENSEKPLSDVQNQTAVAETNPRPDLPDHPVNFTAAEYQAMAEAWKTELATGGKNSAAADITQGKNADTDGFSLEDRIAELEEAVSRSRESWEPDGSEPTRKPELRRHLFEVVDNTRSPDGVFASDGAAPAFRHGQDPAEPLVLVERIDTVKDSAPPSSPTVIEPPAELPPQGNEGEIVQDDDVFLDVETLRNMIGELVREELHGKMGERITRNVRKMVQQEIEKALLARKVD